MKKVLVVLILICLVLTGCSDSNKTTVFDNTLTPSANDSSLQQAGTLIVNERSNGQPSIFNMGMSKEAVINSLKKLGITNINEVEITSTPDAPNWGNKFITTEKYNFEFNKNIELCKIFVLDNTPTSLELKNGDSKEKMEEIYGTSYKTSQVESSTLYTYEWGNKVFGVMVENSIITQWRVSNIEAYIQDVQQPSEENGWYAGAIGSSMIHARFEISGNKVSGVYYYDQYKTNISIKGLLEDNIKDFQTIALTEDTDKKGEIQGIFRTEGYIQGFWKSGNDIYPMYLIKEGSNINPPNPPNTNILQFDGHWTGKNSGYFGGSQADIKALFKDMFYYRLNAYNGANSGTLDSFGIISGNTAKTVFQDKTYSDKKENVTYEFKVENNQLILNSNMYEYMCGMGVSFDSGFVKGKLDIPVPTALEVGIVDTRVQDELFKMIVGDKYERFISYTSHVAYSETTMDGEKVKAGNSILRGLSGYCSYIISPSHIYAAIIDNNGIYYYTNDANYSNKLPKPIADWAAGKSLNIIYTYKQ